MTTTTTTNSTDTSPPMATNVADSFELRARNVPPPNANSTTTPTRSTKRTTAVSSSGSTAATCSQLQMPNATIVSKHQPKKKKNVHNNHHHHHHSSTPHSIRRTFSMTDEEFEEYVEEDGPPSSPDEPAATVAKCSNEEDEEDKDSVVETTTSEDDEEYEQAGTTRYSSHCIDCHLEANVAKYRQLLLDEVDNTSDLTSSPPPPISSPSCYSSPATSPSCSSLNPLQSLATSLQKTSQQLPNEHSEDHHTPPPPPPLPESSNHVLDQSFDLAKCDSPDTPTPTATCHLQTSSEPTTTSCCPLCCPDPEVRITDNNCGSEPGDPETRRPCCPPCTKSHLLPYYPPTVSSIRDAVSHLTRLDDFNVVKLSHGFFSQVFKVVHFSTKKVMVLKMNKEAGNRGNALKEIELLNKLNHENIVTFMGTVVHEGALHPLLEFINGGTLEQLIRPFYTPEDPSATTALTGTYTPPSPIFRRHIISPKVHRLRDPDWTFLKLMRDVSRGMEYLHSMGYLHRDLASKNIFIRKLAPSVSCDMNNSLDYLDEDIYEWYDDDRLVAVIGDFGFATTEPAEDQKLSTVGSPYWLAPECFKNLWYNHKCDIYSFGVICCELNWRIPADPDYLPRFDDNFAVDFGKLKCKMDTPLGKVAKLACNIKPTSRPEFSTILDMFDFEMNKRLNSPGTTAPTSVPKSSTPQQNGSHATSFKRGYSLDSSMLQSVHLQATPPLKSSNYNESDVFEQHLLRRRYSSALASASKTTTPTSSPSATVANSCAHAHYHRHHHHLVHRNYSNPLPDVRRT